MNVKLLIMLHFILDYIGKKQGKYIKSLSVNQSFVLNDIECDYQSLIFTKILLNYSKFYWEENWFYLVLHQFYFSMV